MITRLYEYMEKMPGINLEQLAAIKSLFEQVQRPLTTTKSINLTTASTQATITAEPVILTNDDSKIYQRAKKLLLDPFDQNGDNAFRLMPKPLEFYSDIQQDIYNGFLQPYHAPVNARMIWTSLRFGMSTAEMIKIKHAYTAVNNIMAMIYERQEKPTKAAMSLAEKTEMDLVDQYLRQTMHEINHYLNRRNRDIKMTDSALKLFNVTRVGDNLEVTIDPVFLQYSSGLYAEQLKSSIPVKNYT